MACEECERRRQAMKDYIRALADHPLTKLWKKKDAEAAADVQASRKPEGKDLPRKGRGPAGKARPAHGKPPVARDKAEGADS